jgi:hypothetical protein
MRTGYMFDSVVYICVNRALKIRKTVSRSKMSLVAAGPRQFPTPTQVQTFAGNGPSGNNDDDYDNNDVDEHELKALYTSNQQLLVHTGVHSNDSYLDASPTPSTKLTLAVEQQQTQTQPQAQILSKPQPPPQRVFASTQALIQSLVQSKAQSPVTPSTVTLSTPHSPHTPMASVGMQLHSPCVSPSPEQFVPQPTPTNRTPHPHAQSAVASTHSPVRLISNGPAITNSSSGNTGNNANVSGRIVDEYCYQDDDDINADINDVDGDNEHTDAEDDGSQGASGAGVLSKMLKVFTFTEFLSMHMNKQAQIGDTPSARIEETDGHSNSASPVARTRIPVSPVMHKSVPYPASSSSSPAHSQLPPLPSAYATYSDLGGAVISNNVARSSIVTEEASCDAMELLADTREHDDSFAASKNDDDDNSVSSTSTASDSSSGLEVIKRSAAGPAEPQLLATEQTLTPSKQSTTLAPNSKTGFAAKSKSSPTKKMTSSPIKQSTPGKSLRSSATSSATSGWKTKNRRAAKGHDDNVFFASDVLNAGARPGDAVEVEHLTDDEEFMRQCFHQPDMNAQAANKQPEDSQMGQQIQKERKRGGLIVSKQMEHFQTHALVGTSKAAAPVLAGYADGDDENCSLAQTILSVGSLQAATEVIEAPISRETAVPSALSSIASSLAGARSRRYSLPAQQPSQLPVAAADVHPANTGDKHSKTTSKVASKDDSFARPHNAMGTPNKSKRPATVSKPAEKPASANKVVFHDDDRQTDAEHAEDGGNTHPTKTVDVAKLSTSNAADNDLIVEAMNCLKEPIVLSPPLSPDTYTTDMTTEEDVKSKITSNVNTNESARANSNSKTNIVKSDSAAKIGKFRSPNNKAKDDSHTARVFQVHELLALVSLLM